MEQRTGLVGSVFGRERSEKRVSGIFDHDPETKKISASAAKKSISFFGFGKKELPVGIDIGTKSIKAVRLGFAKDGVLEVQDAWIKEFPADLVDDEKKRESALPGLIKEFVEEKRIKGKCFAAMPSFMAGISLLRLPVMPEEEIEKALVWQLKQRIKTDLEEVSFDYIVLNENARSFLDGQIGCVAVTVPKKDVADYLSMLRSAGLEPVAIDVAQCADVAAFVYSGGESISRETVLFLDFGADRTSLSVVVEGELVYTRALSITGNYLTGIISRGMGVGFAEAEKLKMSVGVGDDCAGLKPAGDAAKVCELMMPVLDDIVQYVEHTFKHFSHQLTQSRITKFDRLVLSGGASKLKGFVPFLRNRLGVEVTVADAFNKIRLSPAAKNMADMGPLFNVSLGLALRGVDK